MKKMTTKELDMDAPNKIYVEVCEDGIFAFPEPPFKESVEYIRADLVGQSLQQKEPDKSLEEAVSEHICIAADKHIKRVVDAAGHPGWDWTTQDITEAFIAGAEWQAETDKETIKLAEDHAYLAGAVNEKEQMLKDAVECELYWDGDFLAIDLNMAALGYSERDKVKVIVLKAEEE